MNAVPKPASKHIVRITEGGQLRSFAVSKDEFLIGRDEKADIRITNSDVSSKHLYVKIVDGLTVSLRDPGSTNGTFVGGERLQAGKETVLESLSDEIMLGKVAKLSITPAALQPSLPAQPKSSSRLALVKEKPAPEPEAAAEPALEIESPSMLVERGTLAGMKSSKNDPDRIDLDIGADPEAAADSDDEQPDRVVISAEASRLLLRPEPKKKSEPAPSPVEEFAEAAVAETVPVDATPADAPEHDFTEEEAHAAEAAAKAEQAVKAAARAQEAALAAAAAHEKAKASAAAREKAKAEKIKSEAEAREKAKLEVIEREKAKAQAAAEAAREKAKAAAEADEAAKAAALAHENAKLKAQADAEMAQAAITTQNLHEAARAEIAAFKKKAILDIEVVQTEAISFSELVKQEGQKDAEAIRETGRQEIAKLRDDANREIERLKEFAAREAEALREDARRQGEAAREEAEREITALKDDGRRAADAMRDDGRREAENLKAQAKKEIESHQYECERLKNDAERTKSEIEHLKVDNDRLRIDGEKLRADYRDESGKLAVLRQEADSIAKISEVQKTQAEAALRDITQRRDGLAQECDQIRQKVLEAANLRDSLAKEKTELELKIIDGKKAIERAQTDAQADLDGIKHQIERETREAASVTTRLTELKQAMRTDEDGLKIIQDSTRREKEFFEADERKRKAIYEALDAEYRVKRLSVDAQLGELELKRSEVEREVHKLKTQVADLEQQLSEARQDTEAQAAGAVEQMHEIEKEAQKAREKVERYKQEGERLTGLAQEHETTLAQLRKKTEEAKKETFAAQEALQQSQNASAEARRHVEQELSQVRTLIEAEAKKARDHVNSEVALMRQAAQEETLQEIARRKEALKVEFVERGKAMEREIADAKLKELKIIQGMQEEEKKALRLRMEKILDDLVHKTIELARQTPIEHAKNELRDTLQGVLEGKSAGTLSVEADERSKKFFKKMAKRAAIPAGVVLFFVIFPGLPGAIKDRFSRTVASEKNDSGVFLDQIKQRALKFQPEMDRNYRDTYSDNILYLDDYVEMKLNDKEQKEWTLVLNDFIVGRLGLSDRIIPDFISGEAVMVQDLMHIREGILPQFKDQGLARMAETEKTASDKLISLLQSPENYKRFRTFEKDYYDNYIKRPKPASTATATPSK